MVPACGLWAWLALLSYPHSSGGLLLQRAVVRRSRPAAITITLCEHAPLQDAGKKAVPQSQDVSDQPTVGRGVVWRRVRQRFEKSGIPEDLEAVAPLVEGVSEDIESAIAARKRLLRARLGSSLKHFRQEVLEEVNLQADEAKGRQERLLERRDEILASLHGLQEDIIGEVDVVLSSVKRGGETLEKGLRSLRDTWEGEVDALIEEARNDIDLAVTDLQEAIDVQRTSGRGRSRSSRSSTRAPAHSRGSM